MNLPTLQELKQMKTDWLFDQGNIQCVKNAIKVTMLLGEPIVVGGRDYQRLRIDGWVFTYSSRPLRYNPGRKEYIERRGFTIENEAGRTYVRYIQIDEHLDAEQSHIVPDEGWKVTAASLLDVAAARLNEIKEASDLAERQRLAKLLLIID